MNINTISIDEKVQAGEIPEYVIKPRSGFFDLDLKELWHYRDLFYFLVWRDVKVRYAQSILGVGWAVVQPVFSMIVFTIVFGKLAKVSSDGMPYSVWNYTALVPWTYFSTALTDATGSLIKNTAMIQKIYFPRMFIPLTPVFSKLLDFAIASAILFLFMIYFQVVPTSWVIVSPLLIFLMLLSSAGTGMWLTALAIQYRDVNYAMPFTVQLLMFSAPVVYPTSLIPEQFRLLYALNPMVGVIEGFRASLLGTTAMPWDLLAASSFSAAVIFVSGAVYFRHKERIFADVA